MTLKVLKHGGPWDLTAEAFRFKKSKFEQVIKTFADVIADFVYDELVQNLALQ